MSLKLVFNETITIFFLNIISVDYKFFTRNIIPFFGMAKAAVSFSSKGISVCSVTSNENFNKSLATVYFISSFANFFPEKTKYNY